MSDDSGIGSDSSGWSFEDELGMDNFHSSSKSLMGLNGVTITEYGEASSSAGPSNSKIFDHFTSMGFPRDMVSRLINDNGEENEDKLLEKLLTYSPQYNEHAAKLKKRSFYDFEELGKKKPKGSGKRMLCEREGEESLQLPKPMIGFPTESKFITQRKLPEDKRK